MSCGRLVREVTARLCASSLRRYEVFLAYQAHTQQSAECAEKTCRVGPLIALDFINEFNDVWRKGDEAITCAGDKSFRVAVRECHEATWTSGDDYIVSSPSALSHVFDRAQQRLLPIKVFSASQEEKEKTPLIV